MTIQAPTMIAWPEGGKPYCTRCNSQVVIYLVFMDDNPVVMGTRCPDCDPYTDNKQHFKSWKSQIPFRLHGHIQLKVPQDETAWKFAEGFMQRPGTRVTRPSPGGWH